MRINYLNLNILENNQAYNRLCYVYDIKSSVTTLGNTFLKFYVKDENSLATVITCFDLSLLKNDINEYKDTFCLIFFNKKENYLNMQDIDILSEDALTNIDLRRELFLGKFKNLEKDKEFIEVVMQNSANKIVTYHNVINNFYTRDLYASKIGSYTKLIKHVLINCDSIEMSKTNKEDLINCAYSVCLQYYNYLNKNKNNLNVTLFDKLKYTSFNLSNDYYNKICVECLLNILTNIPCEHLYSKIITESINNFKTIANLEVEWNILLPNTRSENLLKYIE